MNPRKALLLSMASSIGSIGLFVLLFALQSQLRFGDWPESRAPAPIGVAVDEGRPPPDDGRGIAQRGGRRLVSVAGLPEMPDAFRRQASEDREIAPQRRRAYLVGAGRTRDIAGGGGRVQQGGGGGEPEHPVPAPNAGGRPPAAAPTVPAAQNGAPQPRATKASHGPPSSAGKGPKHPRGSRGSRGSRGRPVHRPSPAARPAPPSRPAHPHGGGHGRAGGKGRPGR